MYKNIVLPLDGSDASESAIPHAEQLALGCEAKHVTIVHVVEQDRYEGMLSSGKRPGVYVQRAAIDTIGSVADKVFRASKIPVLMVKTGPEPVRKPRTRK